MLAGELKKPLVSLLKARPKFLAYLFVGTAGLFRKSLKKDKGAGVDTGFRRYGENRWALPTLQDVTGRTGPLEEWCH